MLTKISLEMLELMLSLLYPVLGNYICTYLINRAKLDTFVVQALTTLFARITKLGWFDTEKDEYVFRNVIVDVGTFLRVIFMMTICCIILTDYKTFYLI